jgi:Prokaryotic N-terminal methylation motif
MKSLNAEHGFTLMEAMVAMVTGLVLTTASFLLLQLVTEQSSRATDFVQASQLGRTAMTHVVDELSSACVVENATPIQEGSTSERLIFVAAYSEKAEVKPSEVQEHEIYWKEGSSGGHPEGLYDAKRLASKQNGTEWEWAGEFSKPGVLIDADLAREKPEGKPELFRYFEFGKTVSSPSATTGLSALKPISLSEHQELLSKAASVASVEVKFRSLPADKSEKVGRDVALSNQVTFAFSAGFTEPTVTSSGACQNQ